MMEARANKLGVTPAEAEAWASPTAHLAETTSIMVDASEIGFLAAYLASDKSWAITGEVIMAGGGISNAAVYY